MRTRFLSKSLQVALCAVVTLAAIALLKPDALDLREQPTPRAPRTASGSRTPWLRSSAGTWKPVAPAEPVAEPTPAPTAADTTHVLPARPAVRSEAPPQPTAPDPDMRYLGRIEQDGRSAVFLGRGAIPQVVEIGQLVDPRWKVEAANATHVEMRYLPTNETRFIAVQ